MSTFFLSNIQVRMNYYSYPVLLTLGIIGNLFNFILFNRQRHNACSIYLGNLAVTNLLYLISNGLFRILYIPYKDGSMRALILCKLSTYLPSFLGQVTKTILVLACIDRYLITSHQVTLRALSTPKRAKYLISFVYIFWLVTASHSAIFSTISNGQCTRIGIYATIFTIYAILFVGLIPSVVLSTFSWLTYRNMKHLRCRIQPNDQVINHTNRIVQRRDRNLLVLVITEVIVYVITTALFPVVHLETIISQYLLTRKSVYHFFSEIFALNVAVLLLYLLSAAPFYIYMTSSTSFRRDFQQLMILIYQKLRKQSLGHAIHQTNQTIT